MEQPMMKFRAKLWRVVVQTETNYRLVGPKNCSALVLQDALFSAARVAIREDLQSRTKACSWFTDRGLSVGSGCSEILAPQEELIHPVNPLGGLDTGAEYPNDHRLECIISDDG